MFYTHNDGAKLIRLQRERDNGIPGVDARTLLNEMKRIVADAEAEEASNGQAVG